ncbi:hypothetical protein WHR41_05281 [Cladosporium halotolerans]|uniref:Uncharacterized protein n=1 Tax=Cladosporium halotolerans TaxID=1052096 RepID=A0AB34KN19_9PEZI
MKFRTVFAGAVQLAALLTASALSVEDCTGGAQLLEGGASYGELKDCRTMCYCAASPTNKICRGKCVPNLSSRHSYGTTCTCNG